MKKLFFLLFMPLFLAGCSHLPQQKTMQIYGWDFRKYTAEGFLFTPEKYEGSYESIGVLNITLYSGLRKEEREGGYYGTFKETVVDAVSTTEAIDSMYTVARNMGADAVMNFNQRVEVITTDKTDYPIIYVSGFAIKRKDLQSVKK
jgi:uncharacterized protein YbjQ (UPF0145 family)